ncbi:aminopeptidase O isoform X2 [Micropterus dolomieu]|uniref:aminopeptidase O isoform X2 n=1 Tax=Micropterus dolomieu TaxID=147949 RepID=UPI001E8E7EDB|nr:aminopeptidase O isoform X2 [Micropterus dolomieu]
MEPDRDLNPDTDDLPLRANTNHILVRHYVLDMTVHFDRKVISGSVVLFLEPCSGVGTKAEDDTGPGPGTIEAGGSQDGLGNSTEKMFGAKEGDRAEFKALSEVASQNAGDTENSQSSHSWETTSDGDFTLVLDCCDLDVSKVEEVDVTSVSSLLPEVASERSGVSSVNPQAAFIQNLISLPSRQWRQKHKLFLQCSRAPGAQDGSSLHFHRDRWSLQVRKKGIVSPQEFPHALRICYETRPTGGSVKWTKDQDNRVCVYTAGSPINNRALFPCQEPPVAMSTWQATVRAPSECVVLMSGEEQTVPIEDGDTRFLIWNYYVTMPMPASTFTLAVGHWQQVTAEIPPALEKGVRTDCGKRAKVRAGPGKWAETELVSGLGSSASDEVKGSPHQTGSGDQTTRLDSAFSYSSLEDEGLSVTDYSGMVDDGISCSHGDYPCRFTERSAGSQRVIPHRVFGPVCLLPKAQTGVLNLLPRCLAAAHAVLGVHPFPRLDVLIVPAGFSSLGMASPHIIFLSQSVLYAGSPGSGENGLSLCGSRMCHEIAHSWFGLVIGARDWTEEWISEGFATYLEDIIWAQAQQLSLQETAGQSDLKALLRWRRLSDELQNSEEALQILRPNMENTGQASESGSSTVKHALNPDKAFMQVHYLKGYFLLRFLASQVGEQQFIDFFRLFVKKYHGQLVLSQDFLRMLLTTFPDMERKGLTLSAIYADWLDQPGIPKWLYERSTVWSQARLVEEVKAELTQNLPLCCLSLPLPSLLFPAFTTSPPTPPSSLLQVVKWILLSHSHMGKGRKRKRIEPKVNYTEVTSEQLVMLLELLLEEEELSTATLHALQKTYNLQSQDAEVRHRWCELVVKHAYTQAYGDVEHFLVHDQAMGVYLYGELMVQEDPEQQALASRCLSLVQEEMDQSARRVVEEMVL